MGDKVDYISIMMFSPGSKGGGGRQRDRKRERERKKRRLQSLKCKLLNEWMCLCFYLCEYYDHSLHLPTVIVHHAHGLRNQFSLFRGHPFRAGQALGKRVIYTCNCVWRSSTKLLTSLILISQSTLEHKRIPVIKHDLISKRLRFRSSLL